MKFLEEIGFQPYVGKNVWVRYRNSNDKLIPIFFATTKIRGSIVITNADGKVIISTDDHNEIIAKIRSELIKNLLD